MRAVDYALNDWKAGVGEHDRASLDGMFSTAGWSPKAPRLPDRVPDWCGFSTYYWLHKRGLHAAHRKSFFHVENVEAFYTYGARNNTNPKRLMKDGMVGGEWERLVDIHMREAKADDGTVRSDLLRMWILSTTIRGLAEMGAEFDFRPDDTVLINHYGNTTSAHHITTVLEYSHPRKLLTTIEGNASGLAHDGSKKRDSVVVVKRDLGKKSELHKLYGWGRVSLLDMDGSAVEAYR